MARGRGQSRGISAGVARMPGGATVRLLPDPGEPPIDLRAYVDLIKATADGAHVRLRASGIVDLTVKEAEGVVALRRALEAEGFEVDLDLG